MATMQRLFTADEMKTMLVGYCTFHNWPKKEDADLVFSDELTAEQNQKDHGVTVFHYGKPESSFMNSHANLYLLIGLYVQSNPWYESLPDFTAFLTMITHMDAIQLPTVRRKN